MFIGHYAVALGAKRVAPGASLGTLILATQLVDLLWPLLLLFGLELVQIDPGNTAFTPLNFQHYPITHSLVGAVAWSVLFGVLYFAIRKESRTAIILGCVVLSHWVLDFITHRPDLLIGIGERSVGLGLWNSVAGTLIVEIGLFATGIMLYVKSTVAVDKTGVYAFWGLIATLSLIYLANVFGPPPPNEGAIAVAGNALWLFVLWGYWVDKHRTAR